MVVSKPLRESEFRFCWIGADHVPAHLDLRSCGWKLCEASLPGNGIIGIIDGRHTGNDEWSRGYTSYEMAMRRSILIAGVSSTDESAMLIQMGFGDVVPPSAGIGEIAARARKIADFMQWMPRWRQVGELKLDLVARDVCVRSKPLGLNAREFALLWRLADDLNHTVTKQDLIRDVWRMAFVPRTNSVAVHMSRLRSKLAAAGFDRIIETAPEGGYCLRVEPKQSIAHVGSVPNNREITLL